MAGGGRPDHRDTIGSAMVLVGLGFFVVVFAALFPVLTNPAGAYDKWFPADDEPSTPTSDPTDEGIEEPAPRADERPEDPQAIDEIPDLDGSFDALGDELSVSLEGAVGDVGDDINETIDSALGSIGSTVRGGVVVALFALASLAATVVAWRTAKIGVMLLVRDPDLRARRLFARDHDTEDDEPRRSLEAA